jgi:hypothetical protein
MNKSDHLQAAAFLLLHLQHPIKTSPVPKNPNALSLKTMTKKLEVEAIALPMLYCFLMSY